MTLELSMINDDTITVGELKSFLSDIPDDYNLVVNHLYARKLTIKNYKDFGSCEIKLEVVKEK